LVDDSNQGPVSPASPELVKRVIGGAVFAAV
jgi:hypothetical protein